MVSGYHVLEYKLLCVCWNSGTVDIDLQQFPVWRHFVWVFSGMLRLLLTIISLLEYHLMIKKQWCNLGDVFQAWLRVLSSLQSTLRILFEQKESFRLGCVWLYPWIWDRMTLEVGCRQVLTQGLVENFSTIIILLSQPLILAWRPVKWPCQFRGNWINPAFKSD